MEKSRRMSTELAPTLEELLALPPLEFVKACYRWLLGRKADESGLSYYLERLQVGDSRLAVAGNIVSSDEAMLLPPGRKMLAAQVIAARMAELLPVKLNEKERQVALSALNRFVTVLIGYPFSSSVDKDADDPFQHYLTSVIEDRSR